MKGSILHQRVFLKILKLKRAEPFNLYFVYRGLKKGLYRVFYKKTHVKKMEDFCKETGLHCHVEKVQRNDKFIYHVAISKKKMPTGFHIIKKNGKLNHMMIGKMIGYPKRCVETFGKSAKKYGYDISVEYSLRGPSKNKNSYPINPINRTQVYYFGCNSDQRKHVDMMRRKFEREIKKNLLPLFQHIMIFQGHEIF